MRNCKDCLFNETPECEFIKDENGECLYFIDLSFLYDESDLEEEEDF